MNCIIFSAQSVGQTASL